MKYYTFIVNGVFMTARKKAQDIFNESDFVFSKKVTPEEAFPQIEDITVDVLERKGMSDISGRPLTIKKNRISEYINCSNSVCYGGGFQLGQIIRSMISHNQLELSGYEGCRGYEGSAKGAKRYRSCLHNFEYKIHIVYKPQIK